MPSPASGDASRFLPEQLTLPALEAAAATCTACDLHERATQTVFGAGARAAEVMLVGEQPGDKEDLSGRPFVGPAGRVLDEALEAAGIERSHVYVTNAVKHFKWRPQGKRRIHEKPNQTEISACRPWLEAEMAAVRPRVVVCLGATAAQALLGPQFRVTRQRGQFLERPPGPVITATVHPSSILRARDEESRRVEMEAFIADLRQVAARLQGMRP